MLPESTKKLVNLDRFLIFAIDKGRRWAYHLDAWFRYHPPSELRPVEKKEPGGVGFLGWG
jgi:hypothetical protein